MKQLQDTLMFVLRSVIAGLALAFVVVLIRPELLSNRAQEAAPNGLLSIADAVEKASPAVVNIYTMRSQQRRISPAWAAQRSSTSLGSGVIIDSAGYIVTNSHVIDGATDVQIQLADGRVDRARLVGRDPETDLALLQVDLGALPAMPLGRSEEVRIGEIVVAIGNPYGLTQTVTQGIVSATGRNSLGLSIFESFIQTDAAINVGNSGGALVNLRGELIGVNAAVLEGDSGAEGISFAIPANLVRGVVQELRDYGRVRRGWLGVVPRDVSNERAAALGLQADGAIELVDIFRNSPAAVAGLRRGDVITHINSQPVSISRQALNLVAGMPPGTLIDIAGSRAGQPFTTTIELVERPVAADNR